MCLCVCVCTRISDSWADDGQYQCEIGWQNFQAGCYKLKTEKLDWNSAQKTCQKMDSHLVSIHTLSELEFITDDMRGGTHTCLALISYSPYNGKLTGFVNKSVLGLCHAVHMTGTCFSKQEKVLIWRQWCDPLCRAYLKCNINDTVRPSHPLSIWG